MNEESRTDKLPQIQGIDVARGLGYVGGDVNLYRRILRRFIEDYGNVNPCKGATSLADISGDTRRFVHSMKGLAGTLGATAVQQKAAALENALHENESGRPDLIDAFNSELAQLISAIMTEASLFDEVKDEASQVGPTAEDQRDQSGAESSIEATIASLVESLQKRQPRQSLQYLTEIANTAWPQPIQVNISAAIGELKKYRFDEVLQIVSDLKPLIEQHIPKANGQNKV
jgi:HPt (histidine-containing phosphotransfer) domain-containing protein